MGYFREALDEKNEMVVNTPANKSNKFAYCPEAFAMQSNDQFDGIAVDVL